MKYVLSFWICQMRLVKSDTIFKVKQNGIDGKVLDLFESYLSSRKQYVVINGSESECGIVKALSAAPLTFLIHINDLEDGIKSEVKFFADHTSLFSIVQNRNTTADGLNHDLNLINQWAFQWKTSFNP